MWAQFQKLLSWRKQEYQRVAESELAHVSGSRAGASCALVSPLSIRQGHATPQLCCLLLYTLHAAVLSWGLYTDRYAFCLWLQLSVQGMTCSACTSAVESALRCARQKQQTHPHPYHAHNITLCDTESQQL